MTESIIISKQVKCQFSARATLVAIGVSAKRVFEPIAQEVTIAQKTVKYVPVEKLLDVYINILSGGHEMVGINKRIRPDRAVQAAFGRKGCAEQSVAQDTLDACTAENVAQMHRALQVIYRRQSRTRCRMFRW